MDTPKIAIIAHFFYLDQLGLLTRFFKNIPFAFDLFASTPPDKSKTVQRLLRNAFPEKAIVFRTVPNRGFDIAPFVCEFRDVYPAYDLVLKLHTKKSSHTHWLKEWGDYLLMNAAGSPEIVCTILKMFAENNNLGLVYPEIIPALKEQSVKDPWQENWRICQELGSRLDILMQKEMPLDFPAGSMFWFRPKALEPLFELGLTPEDFPGGKRIRRNGTLAHAIERLLVLIAEKEGFATKAVCFAPFKTVRDMSFGGRLKNKLFCEWSRLLDLAGIHS